MIYLLVAVSCFCSAVLVGILPKLSDFLRENAFLITKNVVLELLDALRQAVCPYTYDVTPYVVDRLFTVKATSVGRCGAVRWGEMQNEASLSKENTDTAFLSLVSLLMGCAENALNALENYGCSAPKNWHCKVYQAVCLTASFPYTVCL